MLKSKQSKPCFYIEAKVDVTDFMNLRSRLRKSFGVKITTNSFYIYTLAAAVKEFPLMVGRTAGDNIIIADRVNVGFAVNASHGLVVPIIVDADKKSIEEIARDEKQLTEKARSNSLSLADIEGETIALSNLGAYGVDSFVGIVPPPASTILSVGNVLRTVVARDGLPVIRKVVSITVAADHRVVNSHYAAGFLKFIKQRLQNPQLLLSDDQ